MSPWWNSWGWAASQATLRKLVSFWACTCPCEDFTAHSTALSTNYICMNTVSIAQRYNLRSAKYRLNRDFLKNTRLPKEHPAPSTELRAKSFSLEGLHNKQINYAPTKWGSAIKTWITVWFAFLASFHISLLLPLLEAMPEQSNDSQVWKSLLNISAC